MVTSSVVVFGSLFELCYNELMEIEKRITGLESIFNEGLKHADLLRQVLDANQEQVGKLNKLFTYYGSSEWHKHLDLEAKGKISTSLPRGILSEDGIYNLLTDYRDLAEQMRALADQLDKAIDSE